MERFELKHFFFASALLYFLCIPAAVIATAEDPSALVKKAVKDIQTDVQELTEAVDRLAARHSNDKAIVELLGSLLKKLSPS